MSAALSCLLGAPTLERALIVGWRNYPTIKSTRVRNSLKYDDGRSRNVFQGQQSNPVGVVIKVGQIDMNIFAGTRESKRRFLLFAFANPEERSERRNW